MSRTINYCKICKKSILANVWKIHVMGKKHMHYTPKKITVNGVFDQNQIHTLDDYFAQFGPITNRDVKFDGEKVAIDYAFQVKTTHSFIIYKEHKLFNQLLDITWEEVTEPLPYLNNKGPTLNVYKRNTVRPSNNGKRTPRKEEKVIGKPQRKKTDNSESSKLAIINSVTDGQTFTEQITILRNKLQINHNEMEENKKLIHDDLSAAILPTFPLSKINFFGSSITGLDVQGSDLDLYIANVREQTKPEVQTLKVIRQMIFKCRKFCDVLLISGAKIPIIKCIHTKTQLCCDLNIKNKLSVCNSQLIEYYLSLDDKLRPLMIMIKFWADCNDLKKVNYFSSYAIYMMVIFYLQQEYKLPSVSDLQTKCIPDVVDGWNCAFSCEEFTNPALYNESIQELVTGFFKFYGDFDYINQVISPYFGTAIDKFRFLKPYDLPECYQEYMNQKQVINVSSGICIQDPFEHSRNVATSVPLQCIGKFAAMCKNTLKVISKGGNGLLYKVLIQKCTSDYIFEINLPEQNDYWKESIKKLISVIVKDIFNMKCDVTKNTNSTTYTCVGERNVWDNRINILKNLLQLPHYANELDKEIAVSKCINKYYPQSLTINFALNVAFMTNPSRVEFQMRQLNKKCKNFFHACHFFRLRLSDFLTIPGIEKLLENEISRNIPTPVLSKLKADMASSKKSHSNRDKKSADRNVGSGNSPGKQADTSKSVETSNKSSENVEFCENNTNEDETFSNDVEAGVDEEEEEDEDEDVPADFFDDFSNQDFMDGLDIVDAWDDESKLIEEQSPKHSENENDKKSHSPIRFINSKSPEKRGKRYPRSRSKSLARRVPKRSNSFTRKRSRTRSRERLRSDRRDPEKTKRDIHKDKIKCARDKEQKIVNDKLKIVETGLVPPGTEMDVDLNVIMKDKRRSNTGSSVEKKRESKPERERRYPRRSTSRELRKPLRYSRSPQTYRPRPKEREREREPTYRPRKHTGSVDSNISERELWIRSARKRTRSRSRSRDNARRPKTKKYEENKKKSFLEEIRDKLNETRTPLPSVAPSPLVYNMPTYTNAGQHMVPAPVPAPGPGQYFPQVPNQPMQQYDQNFFIGDGFQMNRPQNIMNQPQNVGFHMMGNTGNVVSVPHVQMNPMQQMQPTPVQAPVKMPPAPIIKKLMSPNIPHLSDNILKVKLPEGKREVEKGTTEEDIDKLFADKKISLSDFLTITAKCEVQSSSPEHLQKKIKVISRCQDAIKAMSDDRKFTTGRLSVKPSSDEKNKTDTKYRSPLRRIPVVRFQFTSPAKITEESDIFTVALDKLLQKIGLLKETVDLSESEPVKTVNSAFADEETAALTLKASQLVAKKTEVKSECEECKKRKLKIYSDVGSQCVDNKEASSIGTQVIEEDLNPTKALLKNDSIAYLTPAQLLGKDKEKEMENAQIQTAERIDDKNVESVKPELRKELQKPPMFKGRGGFRKPVRDRQFNNFEQEDYDYEFYDRGRPFEDTRENFGHSRYGGPAARFPRQQFMEEEEMPQQMPQQMPRLQQFREDDNFTDFAHPYNRGRGGRFGHRF